MKRLSMGLSAIAALALVVWLIGDGRTQDAIDTLWAIPWPVALATVTTQVVSYLCRARRLSDEFSSSLDLGFRRYLRISLLHNAGVNVLPFRGGEVTLPWLLQRAGLPFSRAMATLIWLRIQDAIVLATLVLAIWPGIPDLLRWTGLALLIIGVILFRATAARLRAPAWAPRLAHWLVVLNQALAAPLNSWFWSLSNWLTKLLGLTLLLAAMTELPAGIAARGTLGGELSALLPVQGMAGFGTYEAGVAFALQGGDAGWTRLLIPAFALHCFTLGLALLAGALAWFALPGAAPENSTIHAAKP